MKGSLSLLLCICTCYLHAQNVGIGTNEPEFPLQLNSTLEEVADSADILLDLRGAGSKRPAILLSENAPGSESYGGMLIEYDGRLTGGDNRINILDISGMPRYSFLSNGNLGIGTESPSGRLHVVHNSENGFVSPNVRVTESEDDFTRIKFDNTVHTGASWDIAVQADTISEESVMNFFYGREEPFLGRNVMSLRANGTMAIGTDSAESMLHIKAATSTTFAHLLIEDWAGAYSRVKYRSSLYPNSFWDAAASPDTTNPRFNLYYRLNDSTSLDMWSLTDGWVDRSSMRDSIFTYYNANFQYRGQVGFFNDQLRLRNATSSGEISFQTASAERMVIDDFGNVGIGTGDPDNRLDISSSGFINTPQIVLGLISNTSNRPVLQFSSGSTATSTSGMSIEYHGGLITPRLAFRSTSAEDIFQFNNNGNAYKPGGGDWLTLSDRRLKDNIADYSGGLEQIMQIHPVTFSYNQLSGYPQEKTHVGVIAQEIREVSESMVSTYVDDDGNEFLAVDPSEINYMLINAVKELKNESDRQARLIERLLEENGELRAKLEAIDK